MRQIYGGLYREIPRVPLCLTQGVRWAILLSLFLIIQTEFVYANIWKDHLKPTGEAVFDKTGLIIIFSGTAATLLAQPHDGEVRDAYVDHQRMSTSTSKAGDILGTGIPGAAIAATQLYFDRENGIAHAEALIDTMLMTYALKYANQRNRPGGSQDRLSMPSGHTSTTFASATSLTYAYGWSAAIPGYALGAFTAMSRWSDDAHWFSDTVAGATLGIIFGRATWLHHAGISPYVSYEGWGVLWKSEF